MSIAATLGRTDAASPRIRGAANDSGSPLGGPGASVHSSSADAFASAVQDAVGRAEASAGAAGSTDEEATAEQASSYPGVSSVAAGAERMGGDGWAAAPGVLPELGVEGNGSGAASDGRGGDDAATTSATLLTDAPRDGIAAGAAAGVGAGGAAGVDATGRPSEDSVINGVSRAVDPGSAQSDADPATGPTSGRVVPGAPLGTAAATPAPVPLAPSSADGTSLLAGAIITSPARTVPPGAVPPAAQSGEATPARDSATPPTGVSSPLIIDAVEGTIAPTLASATATAHAGSGSHSTVTPPAPDAAAAAVTDAVAGASAPTSGATPTSPASAVAPAVPASGASAARAPLAAQLTTPVVSLVQNGDGEHTLTVRVSPDDLGPVTVKAHISGSSVSIELASGTAAGRDALRALLSDLRRDLAVLVPHSSVAVTTADAGRGDQASSGSGSSSAWAGLAQSGTGSGSGAGAGSGPGSGQSGQPPSGQPSSERSSERNAAAATALDPSLSRSQRDATGIDVFA